MKTPNFYVKENQSLIYGFSKDSTLSIQTVNNKGEYKYSSLKEAVDYVQKDDMRSLYYIGKGRTNHETELFAVDIDFDSDFDDYSVSDKKFFVDNYITDAERKGIPKPSFVIYNNEKGSAHVIWQLSSPVSTATYSLTTSKKGNKFILTNVDETKRKEVLAVSYILSTSMYGDISFINPKTKVRNPWMILKNDNTYDINNNNKVYIKDNNIIYSYDKLYRDIVEYYCKYQYISFNGLAQSVDNTIKNIQTVQLYGDKLSFEGNIDNGFDKKVQTIKRYIRSLSDICDLSFDNKNDMMMYTVYHLLRYYGINIDVDTIYNEVYDTVKLWCNNNNVNMFSNSEFNSKLKGMIKRGIETWDENKGSGNVANRKQSLGNLKKAIISLNTSYKIQKLWEHIYSNLEGNKLDNMESLASENSTSVSSIKRALKIDVNKEYSKAVKKLAMMFSFAKKSTIESTFKSWMGENFYLKDLSEKVFEAIEDLSIEDKDIAKSLYSMDVNYVREFNTFTWESCITTEQIFKVEDMVRKIA